MAKLVLDQAQIVMDSFYQDFRPDSGFFTLEDFADRVVDVRDSELEREFLIQYQLTRGSPPKINPAWLKRIKVKVDHDENGDAFADVCEPLFEFPMDELGSGIQDVIPFKQGCAEFIRISTNQVWQLCMLPPTDRNFYAIEKCRIWLYNFFGCTDYLSVLIVPSQSGLPLSEQTVPDGKAESIREVVMNSMWRDWQVKLGKINVHGDGNPNPQPNETGQLYDLKTK